MLLHYLNRKIRSVIRRLYPDVPPLLVNGTILQDKYYVREGTIKEKPDYDDAWLYFLAKKAKFIFDIGCNIGQSALIINSANKKVKLLMVDPNPAALSIAAENLIRNDLILNSYFSCNFVSDISDKRIEFFTVDTGAAGSMYSKHAVTAARKDSHYLVSTTTVDNLCTTYGFPDLVKVDVEGAEALVLRGAEICFQKTKTIFLVEMHSNPEMSMIDNASSILELCNKHNYKAWYLSKKAWLTNPKQLQNRGRCHLLLLPSGHTLPVGIEDIDQSEKIL